MRLQGLGFRGFEFKVFGLGFLGHSSLRAWGSGVGLWALGLTF